MTTLSLETINLSKKFGKLTALNGVNLNVSECEVFGLFANLSG